MNIVFVFYDMRHLIYNYSAYHSCFLSGFTVPIRIFFRIVNPILPFAKNPHYLACL